MEHRYFDAVIESGKIFEKRIGREPVLVGVGIEVFEAVDNELARMGPEFKKYQDRLIELGEIEVPLTPEEQVEKQSAQINELLDITKKQSAQIEALLEKLNERVQSHNGPRGIPENEIHESGPTRTNKRDRKNRKKHSSLG